MEAAWAHLGPGNAYVGDGAPWYRAATAIRPNSVRAWAQLGIELSSPGKSDQTAALAALEKAVMKLVDGSLGAIARPARVHFISGLPKTRSGKMLRRSIQALAEGRDPGDLTTIEDPAALEQLQQALGFKAG